MNLKKMKIINKFISISTNISSYLIQFFQFVPCASIWYGIMSIPLISYIIVFFQNPSIFIYDFKFFFGSLGSYLAIFGFIFYIYALIFQITHRGQLITKGPYKLVRHPQYLAFIIMTFGMTLMVFETYPVFPFNIYILDPDTILLLIWIGEVLAYIVLAKIEECSLKSKYSNIYIDYIGRVPFMLPFLKFNKEK